MKGNRMENNSELLKRYELFKLQWMIDHGYTLSSLVQELELSMQENEYQYSLSRIFSDWVYDSGFGGAIWPCYHEWLECEAKECE